MARSRLAIVLLGVAFVCLASASTVIDSEFAAWMVKHNKQYTMEELPQRIANYHASKQTVARLNEEAARAGKTTKFAINKFADESPEEFKTKHMGYKPLPKSNARSVKPTIDIDVNALPTSFDWREKGAVTPVKDQGQCGSCWAFSATEGVESAWFLAGHTLVALSPQQVVSCDDNDGGCDGGDLPTAFAYIKKNGMELNSDYPYTSGNSGDDGTCKFVHSKVVAHISGFKYATQNLNETEMQAVSMVHGPLSICVEADTWQFYSSGVITSNCGTDLDHCVQIVGWASQQKTPYWIIRNSWNTDWGINGYIYVERNKDLCGVAMEATYVTINN